MSRYADPFDPANFSLTFETFDEFRDPNDRTSPKRLIIPNH